MAKHALLCVTHESVASTTHVLLPKQYPVWLWYHVDCGAAAWLLQPAAHHTHIRHALRSLVCATRTFICMHTSTHCGCDITSTVMLQHGSCSRLHRTHEACAAVTGHRLVRNSCIHNKHAHTSMHTHSRRLWCCSMAPHRQPLPAACCTTHTGHALLGGANRVA